MMKRIALTGGIACGKSTLARFLEELGCAVWDADSVVHALEAAGGAAVEPIQAAFGAGVQAPDGGIDRRLLGARVFADPAALKVLNSILHPLVRADLARWLAVSDGAVRVAVIPLLFEVGWERDWDAVVCVTSAEGAQLSRLAERGLTPEQARARLAAQMPVAEKVRRASHVVQNDGTLDALRQAAEKLVKQMAG